MVGSERATVITWFGLRPRCAGVARVHFTKEDPQTLLQSLKNGASFLGIFYTVKAENRIQLIVQLKKNIYQF